MTVDELDGVMDLLLELFPVLVDDTPDRLAAIRNGIGKASREDAERGLQTLVLTYRYPRPTPADVVAAVKHEACEAARARARERDRDRKDLHDDTARSMEYRLQTVQPWLDSQTDDHLREMIAEARASRMFALGVMMTEKDGGGNIKTLSVKGLRYGLDSKRQPNNRDVNGLPSLAALMLHEWVMDRAKAVTP